MLKTGLGFAPGTADDAKRLIQNLFPLPNELLDAYRAARQEYRTGDIVLVCPHADPSELYAGTRAAYGLNLQRALGEKSEVFAIKHKSAHSIVQMPAESEVMWLVIEVPQQALPVMCVIFALPYETVAADASDVN